MWRKSSPPKGDKISRRVGSLPRADLVTWSDQALYAVGRNLTAYQRDPLPEYLYEAQEGAQVLLAIVEEIRRREGV
jgi:hypothetical protein